MRKKTKPSTEEKKRGGKEVREGGAQEY